MEMQERHRLSCIHRSASAVERLIKGAIFDCKMCGQCLLSHTAFVCPMNCPKGLRNGPCGGTIDGKCEVVPERPCVWMRILEKRGSAWTGQPQPLHAPFDLALLGSSSVWNLLSGADRVTRLSRKPPAGGLSRKGPSRTPSRLERALRSGFAITSEVRSPRTEDAFARVEREVRILAEFADAINATSNHGGREAIPSARILRLFPAIGVDGILQICGRDVDADSYLDDLVLAEEAGVRNLLCLTGDWRPEVRPDLSRPEAAWRNYFRMDSSQMLAEARTLALEGRSAFSDLRGRPVPRPYVGAVINPFSTPRNAVVARLAQKMACGVEFVQTQIVLAAGPLLELLSLVSDAGLRERVFVLATIPVIGSAGAFDVLCRLPGVLAPDFVRQRIDGAEDVRREGSRIARELMSELYESGAVDGFHLVNFGAGPEAIRDLALDFRRERRLPRMEGEAVRA